MKRVKLKVESREGLGRGPARRLREAGKIPAVVYGTSGSFGLSIEQTDFRELTRSVGDSAAIIELEKSDGAITLSVIQEVQTDALKDRVNHIDFHEVNAGVEMTAHVPVHVINEDKCNGVRLDGGMIELHLHSVDVRTLPRNLPEYIEVDVSALRGGESVHLRDLQVPEGVTIVSHNDTPVVSCVGKSTASEDADAADAGAGEA